MPSELGNLAEKQTPTVPAPTPPEVSKRKKQCNVRINAALEAAFLAFKGHYHPRAQKTLRSVLDAVDCALAGNGMLVVDGKEEPFQFELIEEPFFNFATSL